MNQNHAEVPTSGRRQIQRYLVMFTLAAITLFCWGCGKKDQSSVADNGTVPCAPDYRQDSSWVFRDTTLDKPVDVFYVYPTIYNGESPANMDIQNQDLRSSAEHVLDAQASVYFESANVFAPYYRQMSMKKLDPEADMFQNKYFRIGYEDVSRAFEYYLKHFNNGRPFILAGHSQGSMALIALMRERFEQSDLQSQLVAAYLIGYSVTGDDFKNYPWMKPATQAGDTGVIVSYNTQAPEATGSPVLLPGAYCINPLNWTTDAIPADKSLNLGAVFFSDTSNPILRQCAALSPLFRRKDD